MRKLQEILYTFLMKKYVYMYFKCNQYLLTMIKINALLLLHRLKTPAVYL